MENEISSWNMLNGLSYICKVNKICASKLLNYLSKQIWSQQDREALVKQLSDLLLHSECIVDICVCFRPLILELAHRLLHTILKDKHSNVELLKKFAVLISHGFCVSPELQRFAVDFVRQHKPFLQTEIYVDGEPSKKKKKKHQIADLDWCCAMWNYLLYLPELSDSLDLHHLTDYLSSSNSLVRWFAALSLSRHLHLSECERNVFLNKYFSLEEQRLLLLRTEKEKLNSEKKVLLAKGILQVERLGTSQSYTKQSLLNSDMSESVLSFMGILLPMVHIQSTDHRTWNPLVLVPSTQHHLKSLALAVASCKPVMLQGPVGCGKTCLVEHLAHITGRTRAPYLLKIQLGDQTDSKALLGTYCSTEVPGEFVWRAGVLTRALYEGSWLLLEDVDTAPMDVLSLLIALAETGKLSVPGHGDEIRASPGFQLFVTRRLHSTSDGLYESKSGHCSGLEKLCSVINLEPLSREELKEVITVMYPVLEPVVDKLLDIYFMLSSGRHHSIIAGEEEIHTLGKFITLDGRPISTRDLMTWCSRSAVNFNHMETSQGVKVFLEALDCFVSCLSKNTKRIALAAAIGEKLNVTEERAKYFCTEYKPSLEDSVNFLKIGRDSLKKQKQILQSKPAPTFSYTRSSMVLLEKVSVCIQRNEPVLLCGETGTGKTSTIHFLAHHLGHKLHVINLNQQSDSTDLLGGFKPVDFKFVMKPLREEFETLFCECFSRAQNEKFLSHIQTLFAKKRWKDLLILFEAPINKALMKYDQESLQYAEWNKVKNRINELRLQIREAENVLAFSFIEGALVKALKNGDWVLLDEINLAAAETLECLSGLLESVSGSVVLTERGDVEPVIRHPDFRLFACMNPATDVGKKDLPVGIRNRLTEFYVEELECPKDLSTLVRDYLTGLSLSSKQIAGIVNFYLNIKNDPSDKLTDGTGHKPHYSLRTLCRALRFCGRNPCQSVPRSLYEGFCLSFLTQLDRASHPTVCQLICKHLLPNDSSKAVLSQKLPKPEGDFINVADYWISKGQLKPIIPQHYILTASVKLNLKDLARVVSAGKHPVLLQGETSVGKTSLIHYLAQLTGNVCLRVNNHEHTDIQEYIGSYVADELGKLVFKDGVLVEAMRKGYWIILDELNLAPTDVLEALNRLLDDNQELFIPETQEMVQAHPKFILFATQNPPGLYGGRKILSRAFRNRFIELHFDEIPPSELEIILHERCEIPLSYAKKLVSVMLDLQTHRRGSGIFFGKHGFMTLRDLFRWATRYKCPDAGEGETFYDWDQHLAEHGYLLLAGRVRKIEEETIIKEVLQKHFKRILDVNSLYSITPGTSGPIQRLLSGVMEQQLPGFQQIVWTYSMRRLAVLIGQAIKFKEPVLLVGSTGVGKTTICQLYAAMQGKKLYSINCHMHTESADFLGGLRPVRSRENSEKCENQKLFEWKDGPLILAMKEGSMFLVDEISLADDSVLERLNSVLEPERTLVLAEKGGTESTVTTEIEILRADEQFQVFATMNPGGDFGKKELSPALRNRFTEIWCPQSLEHSDLVAIIEKSITSDARLYASPDGTSGFGHAIMEFIEWFLATDLGRRTTVSIRDIINWAYFINTCTSSHEDSHVLDPITAYIHGACIIFIDSLGTGSTSSIPEHRSHVSRIACLQFLHQQLVRLTGVSVDFNKCGLLFQSANVEKSLVVTENTLTIYPFTIRRDPVKYTNDEPFTFDAPTTYMNAQKLLRALQLSRPILLEGSPGVGKTTLVAAVARMACKKFTRINLSEQTDVTDLFGADLPVEGGEAGMFAWRDGPFLQALKAGHWVILDELNLASQSVLEGLNACFDHRGEIYIPELGKMFYIQPDQTRIFACQNPLSQGGGRKGLPQSFLNRFTQVYIDPLTKDDLVYILSTLYPEFPKDMLSAMMEFNSKVLEDTMEKKLWAVKGSPWEFNLRDLYRWCDLLKQNQSSSSFNPGEYIGLIYVDRMRTLADKLKMEERYISTMGSRYPLYTSSRKLHFGQTTLQVGHSFLVRENPFWNASTGTVVILHHHLEKMESLMKCVEMGWLAILLGSQSTGKTSLVKLLAQLTGNTLVILPMNSSMDTIELLGGFEQTDVWKHIGDISSLILQEIKQLQRKCLLAEDVKEKSKVESLERHWSEYIHLPRSTEGMSSEEHQSLLKQHVQHLQTIVLLLEKVKQKDLDNGVLNVGHQLAHLINTLSNRKSGVCGGGTFEWVDSVLVKALQNGHWLLIDNVNFCCASVLDRLNALLEPKGILSINERGTVDGVTVNIVPHPQFRLFFAMDPKHGEMSRAMRNRGVEICLLGEDDDCPFSKEDVSFMLQVVGLASPKLLDWLIALHSAMRSQLPYGEKPVMADLLHAGSLLSQLLAKGYCLPEASRHIIQDVYVSATKYSTTKQIAKDLAVQCLSELPLCDQEEVTKTVLPRLKMSLINDVSYLSQVKMASVVLLSILQDVSGESEQLIQDKIKSEAAASIFVRLQSEESWQLSLDWLSMMTSENFSSRDLVFQSFTDRIRKLLAASLTHIFNSLTWKQLQNVLQKIFCTSIPALSLMCKQSWDLNMNPQACQRALVMLGDVDTKTQHNLNVLKSFTQRLEMLQHCCQVAFNLKEKLDTMDQAKGNKTQHKVVGLVSLFLSELADSLPDLVLTMDQETLEQLNKSYLQLHWLYYLADTAVCSQSLPKEVFLAFLSLHWHWVVDKLSSLMAHSTSTNSKLYMASEELKRHLGGGDNQVKLYIRFWHSFGHPRSYATQVEADFAADVNSVRTSLNTCHVGTLEKIKSKVELLAGTPIVQQLWNMMRLLDQGQWLQAQEDLVHVKQILSQTSNLSQNFPSRLVSLWPLFDHLALVVEMSLYSGTSCLEDEEICQDYILTHIPRLPGFTCHDVLNQMWGSPSSYNHHLWIEWPISDEELLVREVKPGPAVFHQAIMSKFIMHTLTRHSTLTSADPLPLHIALGRLEEERQQLSHISRHVWAHSATLANTQYGINVFEQHFLLETFMEMLSALGSSLLPPLEVTAWQQHVRNVLSEHKEVPEHILTDLENRLNLNSLSLQDGLKSDIALCFHHMRQVMTNMEPERRKAIVGSGLVYVGLVLAELLSPKGPVDPMQKSRIKLEHFQQESKEIHFELEAWCTYLRQTTGRRLSETPQEYYHPRVVQLLQRQLYLKDALSQFENCIAYRPDPLQFSQVSQAISGLLKNTCSRVKIADLVSRLICENQETGSSCVTEEHVWQDTTSRFIQQLQNTFHCFKDVTDPFVKALYTMKFGLRILSDKADRMLQVKKFGCIQSIAKTVEDLCSFPTVSFSRPNLLQLANQLIQNVCSELICSVSDSDKYIHSIKSRLLVCALFLVKAHCYSNRQLDREVMMTLTHILDDFTHAWTQQEELRKCKEAEKSSLFVYKDEIHGDTRSEKEKEEADFRAAYPSFELAFIDVTGANRLEDVGLEARASDSIGASEPLKGINMLEMVLISSVHRDLMTSLSQADWLDRVQCNFKQDIDVLTSSLMSYQIGAEVVKSVYHVLDNATDQSILGSHVLFASSLLQNLRDGEEQVTSEKTYNIYSDSNVCEVIKCKPVLENLRKRVAELLAEWPEHPTLLLLNQLMDRILTFSVTEPVMKFLTGLELVLQKAQDWESNAASFVSMSIQLGEISQLIVHWRKLELSCWKSSLDREEVTCQDKASHWWFHLYQLLSCYINNEQSQDEQQSCKDDLVTSLKTFMESSSVGEYDVRLDMLLAFHCQLVHVQDSPTSKQLLHLLWNLYQFYKQYQNQVRHEIKTMREPIEKKLKGFVKIARWNDMNYWSLKASTEKTHRTVHKFIKEYQAVLHQPVKTLLGDKKDDQLSSEVRESTGFCLETTVQEVTGKLKESVTLNESIGVIQPYQPPAALSGITLLPRLQSLFKKMKKHLLKCVEDPGLMKNVLILDDFTGELIEAIHSLQSLQVTPSSDKEKQQKEAHSINLRKRKRLAELFQYLSDLGLSFRKGVIKNNKIALAEALEVPPVHLSTSSGLPVSRLWSSCDQYFYKCMSRHAQFNSAIISPSKELGMSEVERCRGFIEHFSQLYVDQRYRLVQLTQDLSSLRKYFDAVTTLMENVSLPPQGQSSLFLAKTKHLATKLCQGLSQTILLLEACPKQPDSPSPLAKPKLSPSAVWTHGDVSWKHCLDLLQSLQSKVTKAQEKLETLSSKLLLGREDMVVVSHTMEIFTSFLQHFDWISAQFSDCSGAQSCFTATVNYLALEVTQLNQEFTDWWDHLKCDSEPPSVQVAGLSLRCGKVLSHLSLPAHVEYGEKTLQFVRSVESFVEGMLLSVQNVVAQAQMTSNEELQEAHITKHLLDMETSLLSKLNCAKRISKFEELLNSLRSMSDTVSYDNQSQTDKESVSFCAKTLLHCQPLIKSFSNLIEVQLVQSVSLHRCLGKLLSVLLSVFTELSQKGFCLPPELSDEMSAEGATEFKDIEGGGLGEGEGAKDVSDQIESEDQLEGVKGLDNPSSEEPKDVPSEDNAIEMSDDFDGKIQENETNDKEDNDDDSDKGEEEEMDKQMGDVEDDNNDKLDDRMWGSDEEEDHEDKPDEQGGDGVDQQMEEMVAKEDIKDKAKEHDDERNKEENREENKEENKEEEKDDYDDNQINPHNVDNEEKTEELELPKDLQLDDETAGDKGDEEKMETENDEDTERADESESDKCDDANGQGSNENKETEEFPAAEEVEKEGLDEEEKEGVDDFETMKAEDQEEDDQSAVKEDKPSSNYVYVYHYRKISLVQTIFMSITTGG
ncbi:midasin-like isoform X2 [Biomphalaria glabrata]|uniref:Midasin n=1 Tax=Biomphalaria glabrata TaxID=6526 RepID=A0A9W3ASA1_BIOGL|nr:midasin-like isoform X2 [Biomphalaria glabrata]